MPDAVEYKYRCSICKRVFKSKDEEKAIRLARACEKEHDIVYVPLLKSDVKRLLAFLVSGDEELLTRTMIETLELYKGIR